MKRFDRAHLQQSRDRERKFYFLIVELKLSHGWFLTYFRVLVGQFEALLQELRLI